MEFISRVIEENEKNAQGREWVLPEEEYDRAMVMILNDRFN